jgi:hypothetical protein
MDKVYLRHRFENSKPFLKELYEQKNLAQVFSKASDDNLNTLIKILHLVAIKEVKLHKDHAESIVKSKRLSKLKLFSSKLYFLRLLGETRTQKLLVLKQFLSLYRIILFGFFNDF